MNNDNSIELNNIKKSYTIKIADESKSNGFRIVTKKINKVVLDNVSFSVRRGEVIGIIGRNGSGKSTLLSIIAGIICPDQGVIQTEGTIASILELSMGFQQDMSGRENIYLKGEMYGFSKTEINDKINEIIDYSGINEYIDNPVRTYSSGMVARLAFSILINIEADIYLVDEILSVGDSAFEFKAREHFSRLTKSNKTVIIVSHQLPLVKSLCSRAIWIDKGIVKMDGDVDEVVSSYEYSIKEDPEIIIEQANSGFSEYQYKLAMMYKDGSFLPRDTDQYLYWLKKSAFNGYPLAQVQFGDILHNQGQDDEAIQYYSSSATKGNVEAKLKLSKLLTNNDDEDFINVKNIFKQLAERGNPVNEYRYAELLLKTSWSDEERLLSFRWFEQSANHGNPEAMVQVSKMYRNGIGVAKDYQKMVEYLVKASDCGYPQAMVSLADLYYEGSIVHKDSKKAFSYYLRSAELGNTKSQFQVAMMYKNGIGVEKNDVEANRWFEMYSYSPIIIYQLWAADILKYCPVETDETIFSLYLKAANHCNSTAMAQLGMIYKEGVYRSPNNEESIKWLEKASQLYGWTRMPLADLYYRGYIVKQDLQKAIDLYKSCVCSGEAIAAYRLGCLKEAGIISEKIDYNLFAAEKGNREAIIKITKQGVNENGQRS